MPLNDVVLHPDMAHVRTFAAAAVMLIMLGVPESSCTVHGKCIKGACEHLPALYIRSCVAAVTADSHCC
jgi:hypothetical protein